MNANYAGAGRRFVAVFIDGLIILAVYMILGMVLGTGGLGGANSSNLMLAALSNVVSLAIQIGYFVFYQASAGQTLGKKVMGVKVVDMQGKTPGAMTFFVREIIGKLVSTIILFIGYLMILWDGRKQGLHDKIAGTVVVRV